MVNKNITRGGRAVMKTELDTRALLNVKDLCEYHNKNTEEFQSGNSIFETD